MGRIVAGTEQSALFAEQRDEYDTALGMGRERRQSVGDLDDGGGAAGVVIGAVVDVVAGTRAAHAQVIVMRGHQQVCVRELGIGATEHADDVMLMGGVGRWGRYMRRKRCFF